MLPERNGPSTGADSGIQAKYPTAKENNLLVKSKKNYELDHANWVGSWHWKSYPVYSRVSTLLLIEIQELRVHSVK